MRGSSKRSKSISTLRIPTSALNAFRQPVLSVLKLMVKSLLKALRISSSTRPCYSRDTILLLRQWTGNCWALARRRVIALTRERLCEWLKWLSTSLGNYTNHYWCRYYDVTLKSGKVVKDAIWWYKYPTLESILITGRLCFYNEKVDVFIDGVKQ